MNTATENRAKISRLVTVGLLLATLLAALLPPAPAGAGVVPAGNARSWGDNYFGQLGDGSNGAGTGRNIPGAVRYIDGVKTMKAGCAHSLALLEGGEHDGLVRAWGDNTYGQLGNVKTGTDTNVPVAVYIENVKVISAGCNHNLALKDDGSVWAWGNNQHGQLGNGASGTGQYSNTPVKVADLGTGAKGIAAGENFSLALMKDGTVKSWGYDGSGELGNGAGLSRNKPGPVSNLSNVRAIATDSFADHALALLNNGTVKAWGDDSSGQIGNGGMIQNTDEATPVQVKNLSGVRAVATGGHHSLALLEGGRVKSWGNNFDGQLGDGTHGLYTERSTPGNVIGLDNVRSIAAGAYHSLAVLESGRARSWGDNEYGQLGNGTSGTDSDTPIGIKDLWDVRNIDGGYEFTLAVTG